MLKIHILFELKEGPWGGGNQFLKALRGIWSAKGVYESDPEKADIILFNSHHDLSRALKLKYLHPDKVFLHRMDGVFSTQRRRGLDLDRWIYTASRLLADGVVYQSDWSRRLSFEQGMHRNLPYKIIFNAPDGKIFYPKAGIPAPPAKKRIAIVSWSENEAKGFGIYAYLDEALDFNAFECTFVGNAPVSFRRIKMIPPLSTRDLADFLRSQDLYITASRDDACSNSLLEALYCGLPAVVLDSGGHPEVLRGCGEVFHGKEDLLVRLSRVAAGVEAFEPMLSALPALEDVAREYFSFAASLKEKRAGRPGGQFQALALTLRFLFQWMKVVLGPRLDRLREVAGGRA